MDRLKAVAAQTSLRERTAADAERDMVDFYRAVLMSERIGHEYDGFISNTTSSGFFVQLDQHYVEGFVPAAFIEDDYYVYRPELRTLVGRSSKRSFRLGDRVRVMVDNVDMDSRRILLSLC
jgi:ribonuclease R